MSRIEKLELDPKSGQYVKVGSFELYGSGDSTFGRVLGHKRLDSAMLAFLDALKQVGDFVEEKDPTLKLPHAIQGDKIGGYSIKLYMGMPNEPWTTACKYVLTKYVSFFNIFSLANLTSSAKWILAFVSTRK